MVFRNLLHKRLYRMVHGAVISTMRAHPKWELKAEYASSIAKRAAGTLGANLPEALALGASHLGSSGGAVVAVGDGVSGLAGVLPRRKPKPKRAAIGKGKGARGFLRAKRTLSLFRKQLGMRARAARIAGDPQEHAYVDALRLLAKLDGETP